MHASRLRHLGEGHVLLGVLLTAACGSSAAPTNDDAALASRTADGDGMDGGTQPDCDLIAVSGEDVTFTATTAGRQARTVRVTFAGQDCAAVESVRAIFTPGVPGMGGEVDPGDFGVPASCGAPCLFAVTTPPSPFDFEVTYENEDGSAYDFRSLTLVLEPGIGGTTLNLSAQ